MSFCEKSLGKLRSALLRTRLGLALFKFYHVGKERFTCPVCSYMGPFADVSPETGTRKHAMCPACGSLERHRLQWLVVDTLAQRHDLSRMSILHFAPEPFFADRFRKLFGNYTSADLYMETADVKADLRHLPFEADAYDFVFASHVLEHVREDAQASKRSAASCGRAALPSCQCRSLPIIRLSTPSRICRNRATSGRRVPITTTSMPCTSRRWSGSNHAAFPRSISRSSMKTEPRDLRVWQGKQKRRDTDAWTLFRCV